MVILDDDTMEQVNNVIKISFQLKVENSTFFDV